MSKIGIEIIIAIIGVIGVLPGLLLKHHLQKRNKTDIHAAFESGTDLYQANKTNIYFPGGY